MFLADLKKGNIHLFSQTSKSHIYAQIELVFFVFKTGVNVVVTATALRSARY
jgi:hypothetical protein